MRLHAWLLCGALALPGVVWAAKPLPDEASATHDLEDLRKRIGDAQRALNATEESRTEAADALKRSEQAISDATRTLRELGGKEAEAQQTLGKLMKAQSVTEDSVTRSQTNLQQLRRTEYESGDPDALALMLSGARPEERLQETEYLESIARARQVVVQSLKRDLSRLESLRRDAEDKARELAKTREAKAREQVKLKKEGEAKAKMVAELSSKLQAQKKNLQTLKRDEKRLTDLVERIAKALEERRRQRAQAQREARERAQQKSESGSRASPERAEPVPRIDESAEEGYDTEAFPRMKGKLKLPVTGELLHRFGSPREESDLLWKGIFIRAPEGREIRAVATGRVVYSDWLRGFGNLLIIDHGAGYMTLYGNAEALLARVGAVVKGGEAIATIGNSGGNAEPGVYFELRYQSKPIDPMTWVGR